MENLSNIPIQTSIDSSSRNIYCFNLRELSKEIKRIRSTFGKKDDLMFKILIFYFKRLSKDKITAQVYINDIRFNIILEFIYFKSESKKLEQREYCGNLIEEIISNFNPISELRFYSDNLNNSGKYTIKHLVLDDNKINTLELNNYLFDISNLNKEQKEYIEKFKNLKINNYNLHFKLGSFISDFSYVLNNLINIFTTNFSSTIYYDNTIDFSQISNNFLNFYHRNNTIDDFKFYLINTNLNCSKILDKEEFTLLPRLLLEHTFPEYLEFNYVEIMTSDNSKVEKDVSIFRITKVKYTKNFFCILNSIKHAFSGRKNKKYSQ